MAIVLPDSILSNPGLLFIRQWLLQRTRLIASIDLPGTAFQPHTGTQTSVLILQKKTDREMEIEANSGRPRNYEVFMATPEAVGKDRRGNTLHLRTPEGNLIEHEEEEIIRRQDIDGRWVVERRKHRKRMVHDELPLVVDYFEKWVNRSTIRAWLDG